MLDRETAAAELHGDPVAREVCEAAGLEEWQRAVSAIVQDIEAQFSTRGAARELMRLECLEARDRRAWEEYDAEHRRWRGAANVVKRHAVGRLQELRQRARAEARDWKGELIERIRAIVLDDLDGALDAIAAAIEEYDLRRLDAIRSNGNA